MKLVKVDYSHKLNDAAQAANADVTLGTPAAQECSIKIDDGTMNLLREMHPEQRRLCSVPRKLSNGEHLFHAGDKLDAVYVVQSGIFKRYFKNEAGHETVADFARSGQLLGIEALLHGTASMAAVALDEDASVCALPVKALATVPDTFWSAWLMSSICEERERERLLRSIQQSQSRAETRIAFFLLEHVTNYGKRDLGGRSVRLAIPQEDIASYLDLDLDTVARAFSRLQAAGIIRIERSSLTIREHDLLLALASPHPFNKHGKTRSHASRPTGTPPPG